MNRRSNPLATAFVVLVWTALLLLMAERIYTNVQNSNLGESFNFNFKTMDEINGNT